MAGNLAPSAIAGWLVAIADAANQNCPGCGVRYEPGGYLGELVATTKEGIECLIRAIDIHAEMAPEVVRVILASCRAKVKQQLAGMP